MSKLFRAIAIMIIISSLVAACSSDDHAATTASAETPPTDMPLPTLQQDFGELSRTAQDEAATPVPPTDTPINTVASATPKAPPTATPAPLTAERLVNECAQAMGGIEKIAALETLRIAQHWPDHGLVRYEIKRPNRVRMGDQLVFDGERASWLEGKNPRGTPRLVPQQEWKDFEMDIAWYVPAFFDYPAEHTGTEIVDDIETYKLEVTLPLGAVMTYNLDAQTYLVYRAASDVTVGDQEYHYERTYSDYRLLDGILYPYAFTYAGRDGVEVLTATMEKLEFNVPLEDERFAVPTIETSAAPQASPLAISLDTVDQVELLHKLSGHSDRVFSLAFSGDGVYVASVSPDKTIKLWDAASGQELYTFSISVVGSKNVIAFSPDGRLLASPEAIWDVESKRVVYTLDQGKFGPVAFSPDGSILAVAYLDEPIKLWDVREPTRLSSSQAQSNDVASGRVARTLDYQVGNPAHSIEFSPDGALLAVGGHVYGTVTLWDVVNGQIVHTLSQDAQSDVLGVAFSPDGLLLASTDAEGALKLWDVASGQLVHTLTQGNSCYDVAFSPDGSLLATAGCDNTIKLWDVREPQSNDTANWQLVRTLDHAGNVMSAVFSPDGTLLASGGYDQQIYLWGVPR